MAAEASAGAPSPAGRFGEGDLSSNEGARRGQLPSRPPRYRGRIPGRKRVSRYLRGETSHNKTSGQFSEGELADRLLLRIAYGMATSQELSWTPGFKVCGSNLHESSLSCAVRNRTIATTTDCDWGHNLACSLPTFRNRTKLSDRLSPSPPNRGHCSTTIQPASGSNTLIAVAVSVVVFPKSFSSSTPSWLIMKVITPELPYSAG